MAYLWLLLILLPVFIIVAVWTNIIKKTRVKIVLTIISVFCVLCVYWIGNLQSKLETAEWTIRYASKINTDYLKCVKISDTTKWFGDCILDHLDVLNEIYK